MKDPRVLSAVWGRGESVRGEVGDIDTFTSPREAAPWEDGVRVVCLGAKALIRGAFWVTLPLQAHFLRNTSAELC